MATKIKSKKTNHYYPDKDTKIFAFFAVLLSIIGFFIVYLSRREDKYAMHYAKQSLILFFCWLLTFIISEIVSFIPFIGHIISIVLYAIILALWIIGMIYALSDKEQDIPVIGSYAKLIKL